MASLLERASKAGFQMPMVIFEDSLYYAFTESNMKTMKTRLVRNDDIFLCAYPKSGTHWTWEILTMLQTGKPEYTKHWKNIGSIEMRTEADLDNLDSPRVMNTHLTPSMMPVDVWKKMCRIVNVQRNPKDVLVSMYQQCSQQAFTRDSPVLDFSGSWEAFFEAYMNGTNIYNCVLDYMQHWNKFHEDHPEIPFLQVHYEDLKTDCVKEIGRLADFIGKPASEELCVEIADKCNFAKLKQASETVKDQTFHTRWIEHSSGYFRKGIVGDWKNWFTVAQSDRFDDKYRDCSCMNSYATVTAH